MAQVTWFKQSKGLATKIDPARIDYTPKLGVSHLAEAYNVDYDFTGAISRRLGVEDSGVTGNCHSFYWAGGQCVFVKDNVLSILAEDLSVTSVKTGLASGKRVSYFQVGDAIVYMNGVTGGVIRNKTYYAYTKPPLTHYPDQTREYDDPPVGHIVCFFAGRMWIAVGSTLWYSEPYSLNLFRLATNYINLPGRITMVAPVLKGLFVSTTSRLYFFAGTNPSQMHQSTVAHYPAIEGTAAEVDGIAVGSGQISPLPMQMFTTTNGICLGTSEGQLVNLTYDTLEYPSATEGNAVYTGDKYIVNLGKDSNKLTLCVSLNKVAPSQYANFDYEGMCKFGDKIIGGDSDGLYTLLTGDTDAGSKISAHFRTGPTSFGYENAKSLRKLYLSMRSDGVLKLGISADDKPDVEREVTPHDDRLKIIHQQVEGGRDIKGKYLDLKVGNINGSDFTITDIQAILIVKDSKTTEVM